MPLINTIATQATGDHCTEVQPGRIRHLFRPARSSIYSLPILAERVT